MEEKDYSEELFIHNEMVRFLDHLDRAGIMQVAKALLTKGGREIVMRNAYEFNKMYEVQK